MPTGYPWTPGDTSSVLEVTCYRLLFRGTENGGNGNISSSGSLGGFKQRNPELNPASFGFPAKFGLRDLVTLPVLFWATSQKSWVNMQKA